MIEKRKEKRPQTCRETKAIVRKTRILTSASIDLAFVPKAQKFMESVTKMVMMRYKVIVNDR